MTNYTEFPMAKGATKPSARKRRDPLPQTSVKTVLDQWHRARPELDLGPLGLFAVLAHVYWLAAPKIERLMETFGLTRGMFDVLTTLRRAGPPYTLAPKQLGQSLLLSGAGVTNRLDRLEALQYIRRLPDPDDRRGLKIELTKAGRRIVDRILPALIELERGMSARLTTKKANELTKLLDEFAQTLEEGAPIRAP